MTPLNIRPFLLADGIHPNDKGYELVAERIREAVEPLLP